MPFSAGTGELLMVGIVAFLTIAVPVAVIWLIVQSGRRASSDPRSLLAGRLARGEITRDEYDTAMRALGLSEGPR